MPHRTDIAVALLIGAAPFLEGPAPAEDIGTPQPSHERTVAAIAACGVPSARIRITYEDELQSDLVRIDDLGGADEARFRCLGRAVDPSYILDVSAAPQHRAYSEFADREDRREAKARAIAWLASRNKLGDVPRFDPAGGLDRFARSVEAACSIRKGSALEPVGSSYLTFRRSFVEGLMTSSARDPFTCLDRMIAASNAGEHDVRLVLVGNAAESGRAR